MAGTGMKSIDTAVIRNAATSIQNDKNKLGDTLKACNTAVSSLSSSWTGKAADTTIQAFNTFYDKYSKQYEEMLNKYVQFLNNTAGAGYEETESTVEKIGADI